MYSQSPDQHRSAFAHSAAFAAPAAPTLVLVDCLSGERETITQFPRHIHEYNLRGHTVAVEFRISHGNIVLALSAGVVAGSVLVNDTPLTSAVTIPAGATISLLIGKRLLLFRVDDGAEWPPFFEPNLWQCFDTQNDTLLAELPPLEITPTAVSHGWNLSNCAVCPRGMETGFRLDRVADLLNLTDTVGTTGGSVAGVTDHGKHFCPACWLRFDAGDALSIAAHDQLRGDPLLGPEQMLRFSPTRFNDLGQAIDPMGLPTVELACPHCRRQLPPGYLDQQHKILSLIGAPGSGKSYFLAVLTQLLHEHLHSDFGLVFKDGDPTGNILLNQMRTRLFSGFTPEECILAKTAVDGANYERLPRLGRWVALPRPFIFTITGTDNNVDSNAAGTDSVADDLDAFDAETAGTDALQRNAAVIFYDNAGEHFLPGVNTDDSPGALHILNSAGILFLYDPTSNPRFRQELADSSDLQLRQHGRADQQDSILAQMEVSMKSKLGIHPFDKIPVPVAILVGKCDVWKRLLDVSALPPVIRAGKLDTAALDANSARVRALLEHFNPGLVAQAETLSNNVRYFGVSSLGHSPVLIEDGLNAGVLAPDPARLAPIGVTAPAYWLLSQTLPALFPAA
ncbi:MAG: hypothetical protein LBR07_02415 [Puniceicoccales bacterium]|jgi:energy-coupling factor transporter ATP-binding protein EcfA2|nr:hypothetical protein [Puniceicoccales bacterium]